MATGTVEEVLPNSLFRVRLSTLTSSSPETVTEGSPVQEEEGKLLLAYLAGKMLLHRVRDLVGDQVDMLLHPYGGRARIVRRLT